MATDKTTDYNATKPRDDDELRGGTQGGESTRLNEGEAPDPGDQGLTNPSGGVHTEPPSKAVPRTDVGRGS